MRQPLTLERLRREIEEEKSNGFKNGNRWKQVLDSRNISYVAWNISNSVGSASIFKYQSYDMIDVSDNNLKPWGIYLKNWYRNKSGLDVLKD